MHMHMCAHTHTHADEGGARFAELPRREGVLSWEILGVHNPDESFQSLFDRPIKLKIAKEGTQNMTLENSLLGITRTPLIPSLQQYIHQTHKLL